MAGKKKADNTPEEWAAYLKKVKAYRDNNIEKYRETARRHSAKTSTKAKRKEYDAKPEVKAKRTERENSPGYRQALHAKLRADQDKWEKKLEYQRNKRTGFTNELFDKLISLQCNRCAICRRSLEDRQIHRDHCHDTNSPRGILCHQCNLIEGHIRSIGLPPEEFAKRLSEYLLHPPALDVDNE